MVYIYIAMYYTLKVDGNGELYVIAIFAMNRQSQKFNVI